MQILPIKIKELCTPASVYFYVSVITLTFSMLHNFTQFNNKVYKCGSYSFLVPSVIMIFLFKFVYLVFWTYLLNLMCKDKNKTLAWVLVLFPFILFFVLLGVVLMTSQRIVQGSLVLVEEPNE